MNIGKGYDFVIIGVGVMFLDVKMCDVLVGQDNLYIVVEQLVDVLQVCVIGVMIDYLFVVDVGVIVG